jgi:hypothetical protein
MSSTRSVSRALGAFGFELVNPMTSFQNGMHVLTEKALRGDGVWVERQIHIVAATKPNSIQAPPGRRRCAHAGVEGGREPHSA